MEKQRELKNSSIAWVVSIALVVVGLFAGAFTSFNNMRNAAQNTFDQEIMPTVSLAMEFAFNVQTIAGRYLTQTEIESIGVTAIAQNIQSVNEPGEIFTYYVDLNRAVWAIYDRLALMDMEASTQTLHQRYHSNFLEQDLRLSQSTYNQEAEGFNETINSGLGFLVRPIIRDLPRFDN